VLLGYSIGRAELPFWFPFVVRCVVRRFPLHLMWFDLPLIRSTVLKKKLSCCRLASSLSSLFGDFRWCRFRLYLVCVSSISAASTKFAILLCLLCHVSPLYLHRQPVSFALVLYGFPWLVLHCRSTPIILVV
jgi:hypothetical protein